MSDKEVLVNADLETRLIELVTRSPKLSDRKIRDELGISLGDLLVLGESLRSKLGLLPGADLRAHLRRPKVRA